MTIIGEAHHVSIHISHAMFMFINVLMFMCMFNNMHIHYSCSIQINPLPKMFSAGKRGTWPTRGIFVHPYIKELRRLTAVMDSSD